MVKEQLYRLARDPIAVERSATPVTAETHLPHRGAWKLIQNITGWDKTRRVISTTAAPANIDGHVPPIYPGVILIELINQTSACLLSLLGAKQSLRLSRVLGAEFLAPVPPHSAITIRAGIDEMDDLLARAHGQVLTGDTIAATAIVEVVFDA